MNRFSLESLLKRYGILYSKELGINLAGKDKNEIFKWFLASVLFGARISETIAKNTYKTFEKYGLITPKRILKAGWDFLVNPIMREGGYVRYDGKTSNKILRICETLIKKYDGDLNKLEEVAKNPIDLEKELQEFYGIGPVTSRIFLRELRGIWKNADPEIGKFVKLAAKRLKLPTTLVGLKSYWQSRPKLLSGFESYNYDFRHFEVALLRWQKANLRSKKRGN